MREFYGKHKQAADKALFVAGSAAAIYVCARFLFAYVAPFAVGYLLAAMMEPAARLMCGKLRAPRWLAAAVCVALLAFVALGAGVSAVMKLAGEAREFAAYAPGVLKDLTDAFREFQDRFAYLAGFMPESAGALLSGALESAVAGVSGAVGDAVKNMSLRFVGNIPDGMLSVFLTFISCFFFISDRENIRAAARRLPHGFAGKLGAVRTGVIRAAAGYLKTEFAVVSIIAGVSVAGLLIIRYPYALLAGLIIAAVDALPILGGGMILWPWALFAFVSGDYTKTMGLLGIYGAMFIVRHTIGPRILGEQLGVHPLLTLVATYAGLKLFGFWGLLIGPASLVLIKAALGSGEAEKAAAEDKTGVGSGKKAPAGGSFGAGKAKSDVFIREFNTK